MLCSIFVLCILGTLWKKPIALREGKWSVTLEEWPDQYYAAVACPGSGYFMTGDVVPILRDTMSKVSL